MTNCKTYRAELAAEHAHNFARFQLMRYEVANPWCWACGRGAQDQPSDWFAPWFIHRAHVVSKPRREDRRACALLCPLCHMGGYHRERIVTCERDFQWPELLREHLLWLKLRRDPEYYDRAFMQQNVIKKLPLPRKPPAIYLESYSARRENVPCVSVTS